MMAAHDLWSLYSVASQAPAVPRDPLCGLPFLHLRSDTLNEKRGGKIMSSKFLVGAATSAHQVEGNNIHSDNWVMENLEHSTFA